MAQGEKLYNSETNWILLLLFPNTEQATQDFTIFLFRFLGWEETAGCFALFDSWCLVVVGWLFLAVPWGCLRFVIVVFPDHTHYFLQL